MKVGYTASGFKGPHKAVNSTVWVDQDITWASLVWAAATVGRREKADVKKHPTLWKLEFSWRAAMLRSCLVATTGAAPRLVRSAVYDGMDPSEKGAVSFFVGMAIAKHFAGALLGVPWLMHLDVYKDRFKTQLNGKKAKTDKNGNIVKGKNGKAVYVNTNERPDLFGQDGNGRWYAIESKGRTGPVDKDTLKTAKRQAGRLAMVNGTSVLANVAIASEFYGKPEVLRSRVEDPKPGHAPIAFEIGGVSFQHDYYEHLQALLGPAPRLLALDGANYVVADYPALDLRLGCSEEVMGALALLHFGGDVPGALGAVLGGIAQGGPAGGKAVVVDGQQGFIGPDGVIVVVGKSWPPQTVRAAPRRGGSATT